MIPGEVLVSMTPSGMLLPLVSLVGEDRNCIRNAPAPQRTREGKNIRHTRASKIPLSLLLTLALLAPLFSGCGGAGTPAATVSNPSSGGGGNTGGNGGGSNTFTLSLVAPSIVMEDSFALIKVYGTGFTPQSQVLVDGVAVQTIPDNQEPGSLQAFPPDSLFTEVGVHEFSVQNGSTTSNSLPFTVYQAQQGPQVMNAIPGFLVGAAADPSFAVAADTNGDGLDDVIVPGPGLGGPGSIAILHGQRDGNLSSAQYIPMPFAPYALAAGDVDGDGNVDLVSICTLSPFGPMMNVLLGDGQGNFTQTSAQELIPGAFPGPAYLVDLDGDNKPDLVLATQSTSIPGANLMWLKNLGNGSFAPPVTLAIAATRPFSIADFNQDGKPDILYMALGSPNTLHILFNQGNGSFTDQTVTGTNGIAGPATAIDFNLDGIPDLIVQVQQGQTVGVYSFAGKGDGSFTPISNATLPSGPVQFAVGDFDHDGFPDLVGCSGTEPSELFYLFGDGRGDFVLQQVVGPEGFYVATGDFNGDGLPDVVVPDRFNFVSLALGRTDRNFPSAVSLTPSAATSVSAGDINGDGLLDILIGGDPIHGVPGTIFANLGNNSFQLAANTDPSAFRLADLTGKGVVDLLGGSGPNVVIWPNNLSLDFSSTPITVPQQPVTGPITIADVDGDGHTDIVALGQVLYGDGTYQFTAVPTQNYFYSPYVVGDFNGDGKLDIVSGNVAYINLGNRTFRQVSTVLPLPSGAIAVSGDFNHDGKDDVAVTEPGGTAIAIYYSRGDGTFYHGLTIDAAQYPGALVAGDFNGDGYIDLAVGLELSQQICILFNNGDGQFTRSYFASGADTTGIIAADLNHRGKLDLVFTNFALGFEPANADVVFHK